MRRKGRKGTLIRPGGPRLAMPILPLPVAMVQPSFRASLPHRHLVNRGRAANWSFAMSPRLPAARYRATAEQQLKGSAVLARGYRRPRYVAFGNVLRILAPFIK